MAEHVAERIRLAEWLGLPDVDAVKAHSPHTGWFNPFEDANHGFLVRDHFSNHPDPRIVTAFFAALERIRAPRDAKRPGDDRARKDDYARAALKVLEGEKS